MFLIDLAIKPSENTGINKHAIVLIERKQSSYGPIYTLSLAKPKTLKAYIKTYLKTKFIRPFKSLVGASILFDKKPDNNFLPWVNYQGFHNLIIKN